MGGRICRICASNQLSAQVGALIAEGLPDQKIADAIGIPSKAGRMVVSRHRHAHVEAPARAIVEAASKGQDAIKARKEMVAAAIGGDAAAAFLSLGHITTDLRRGKNGWSVPLTLPSTVGSVSRLRACRVSSFARQKFGPGSAGLGALPRRKARMVAPHPRSSPSTFISAAVPSNWCCQTLRDHRSPRSTWRHCRTTRLRQPSRLLEMTVSTLPIPGRMTSSMRMCELPNWSFALSALVLHALHSLHVAVPALKCACTKQCTN